MPAIVGKRATETDDGQFVTKRTERFSSALNRSLAEAFLDPSPGQASSWLDSVGALLEPFTSQVAMGVSYLAAHTLCSRVR